MKFTSSAILAAMALAGAAEAQCQNIAGNYYCSETNLVQYQNVGYSGTYDRVTSFNTDGSCSWTPQAFSGSLAPLNEELSVHFRGPISLKQFAFYQFNGASSSSAPQKRDHHIHKREAAPAIVTEYIRVTQTITEGRVVVAPSAKVHEVENPPVQSAAPVPAPEVSAQVNDVQDHPSAPTSAPEAPTPSTTLAVSSSAPASSSAASPDNGWIQRAYYNSEQGKADGLVFMNNKGGAGSGTWSIQFGNSISYAGSDGTSCAASPQVLEDKTFKSNEEFMIFTNDKCVGDDCGYYRPGIPAYHGFGGSNRMFLFEFSMPHDQSFTPINDDMPAIWMLNSQIPRTLQYGNPTCSCWATGCGEFDIFEVLNAGNDFLTNHVHTGQGATQSKKRAVVGGGGGTPNYFARPTSGTMKAAVVIQDDAQTMSIVRLDSNINFDTDITPEIVQGWLNQPYGGGSNTYVKL